MSQFTVIYHDAEAEKIVMKRVDETGGVVPGAGSVIIALGDCAGKDLKVYPCPAVVGGLATTIYILASAAPDSFGSGGLVWL